VVRIHPPQSMPNERPRNHFGCAAVFLPPVRSLGQPAGASRVYGPDDSSRLGISALVIIA
jgi:hypothetical protein